MNLNQIESQSTHSNTQKNAHNRDLIQKIKTSLYKQERTRTRKIIQSLALAKNLADLLDSFVTMTRQELNATRVLVYQFDGDTQGKAIAESVESGVNSLLNKTLDCDCFGRAKARDYQKSELTIFQSNRSDRELFDRQKLLNEDRICSSIALPILIQSDDEKSALGDREIWGLVVVQQSNSNRQWQEAEINLLDRITAELSLTLVATQPLLKLDRQSHILDRIDRDLDRLSAQTLPKIRSILKVDRVVLYSFNPDWSGEVIAESVDPQWQKIGSTMTCDCLSSDDNYRASYVVDNIYTQELTTYSIEAFETICAKAYIAVSIVSGDRLLGMLAVFQNSNSRTWQTREIELVAEYATKFSSPLEPVTFIRHAKFQKQRLAKFKEQDILTVIFQENQRSLQKMLKRIRQLMKADRVLVYGFNADWSGEVIAESVDPQWAKAGSAFANDFHITPENCQPSYIANDISIKGFPSCLMSAFEALQAKAYIIIPVYESDRLLGMLGVYQNSNPRTWHTREIDLVKKYAAKFGSLLQQTVYVRHSQSRLKKIETLLTRNSQREASTVRFSSQLVSRLAKISQEEINTNNLLEFATRELRQLLKTSRVAVYQFNDDWSGQFILESVSQEWTKLVGTDLAVVKDTFLQENQGGRYRFRDSLAVNDVDRAGYQKCHLELLKTWQAKAYVIAPIFLEDKLWGLLGVYQNDRLREWEDAEVAIIEQVGTQIGLILQLRESVTKLRSQETEMVAIANREKTKREQLQQGALRVLRALQPSFQGDLTVRAPLSEDEIGTIADGYNTTIQSLRELVRQVQVSATKVSDTSGNNTSSVTQLSEQAQQQVDRLGTALSELQSMVKSTQEVTINAVKVEQAVQKANQTVQNSDNLMEQTVDSILEVRDTVSETAKKIKQLGEASQRISKVVNLIDNFATQTNLLSLNAAIEATRAGEYGKGFAVVADEVRTLAYQSTDATTEIEKLVAEIQLEISEVTAFMEVGISQVVQGSELVDETRQSLREIVSVTDLISGLVEGITAATKTQNQQSQTLTEAMTEVSTLANKTFTDSTQISQSFQELLTTSEELQTSVSRFKVD